jgi:hypothetical protein
MIEIAAADTYKTAGQYRLSFEMFKDAYLTHRQWLRREDDFLVCLEDNYATTLTKVPDRTASEIADVVDVFMDRISFNESKYEKGKPTKLKLAELWHEIKRYEKVLEPFQTEISLRSRMEHKIRRYDKTYNGKTLLLLAIVPLGDGTKPWIGTTTSWSGKGMTAAEPTTKSPRP